MPYTKKGKSYKRNRKQGASKKALDKKITKIVNKQLIRHSESKSKTYTYEKTELYHNTRTNIGEINSNFIMPEQGAGDNMRIGDRIRQSGFKLRLLLGQKWDRPNVTFKIWITQRKAINSVANDFRVVTGNILLDPVNLDQCTVLKSYTIKPLRSTMSESVGGLVNSLEYTFSKSIWIPQRREVKFITDGQKDHNQNPINLIIGVYDAYGSLVTDNIAYVQTFIEYFYRDL